jgi:hypothetical protein
VRRLWHAAEVLGYQPRTLDSKHLAMVAATYLSRAPDDVMRELVTVVASADDNTPDS